LRWIPDPDQEDLRWVIRQTAVMRLEVGENAVKRQAKSPAIDVVCLDDSALHQQILWGSPVSFEEGARLAAMDLAAEIVLLVKSSFEELRPPDDA
jgi:hypothetical protein